jgi:biotin synthase
MSNDLNPRYDWTTAEIRRVYSQPFCDLLYQAQGVHRAFHPPNAVQKCTLLSIKTGGCPENCGYCPQSAHFDTGLGREHLLDVNEVLEAAETAKQHGSTRFCMGAAWRSAPDNEQFDRVLEMVRGVRALGLEACCTLGMLEPDQAAALKDAGLTAYNHNLDTSEAYYDKIITTRTYQDRLDTLQHVRKAGITVCCGGILGMGETVEDRLEMLQTIAGFNPHPESVPINALVRIPGTPLADRLPVDPIEFVRTIAVARITMPRAMVRLSAGRTDMSEELQALCFLAGANSIFAGEQLLTTPNPGEDHDSALFRSLGIEALDPA